MKYTEILYRVTEKFVCDGYGYRYKIQYLLHVRHDDTVEGTGLELQEEPFPATQTNWLAGIYQEPVAAHQFSDNTGR